MFCLASVPKNSSTEMKGFHTLNQNHWKFYTSNLNKNISACYLVHRRAKKLEFFFQKWMANFHISHFFVSSKFQFDFETAQWFKKTEKSFSTCPKKPYEGKILKKNYKFENFSDCQRTFFQQGCRNCILRIQRNILSFEKKNVNMFIPNRRITEKKKKRSTY